MRQTEDEKSCVADASGVDTGPPQLQQDFICVYPEQGILVFDFLNGSSAVDEETVLLHLRLCFHCQEVITVWGGLHESFKAKLVNHSHSIAACAAEGEAHTASQTKNEGAKSLDLKVKVTHGN